ncbi:MAG: sensor histidine kinase [Oscillospiraceae bacterium]
MQKYSLPYHKTTQQRLEKTILRPLVMSAAALIVLIPLIMFCVISVRNASCGSEAANIIYSALGQYKSALPELAKKSEITSALGGGDFSEAYRVLYDFRNNCAIYGDFQLEAEDGSAFLGNDFSSGGEYSYHSIKDIRLNISFKDKTSPVEHRVYFSSGSSKEKAPIFSINYPVMGEKRGLLSFVFTGQSFNDLLGNTESMVFITNEYNHIVYMNSVSQPESYSFAPQKKAANVYKFNDQYYIMKCDKILGSSLSVYALSSFSAVSSVLIIEVIVIAAIVLLAAVFVYRTSFKLTVSATAPFDSLITALGKFEKGDTSYRIADTDSNTQEYIDLFNGVLDDITRLIAKNKQLTEETRLFEIRLLYSQFNPHFMFNMLDNIKYSVIEDPQKTKEMIVTLSKMLRYTMDNVYNIEVPLELDLKYIESYLALQKSRLDNMLEYEISVSDDSLKKVRLPKLVMQPIIENAIMHGFTGKNPLLIKITIEKAKKDMQVKISDNGAGLSDEELRRIRRRLKRGTTASPHIGLLNSHRRLKLLYGQGYGVKIDSEPDKGTTVSLNIKLG